MSCTPPVRSIVIARDVPIWSLGGTAPGTSDPFVLSGDDIMEIAPLLSALRATITISNLTPNGEVNILFQSTNDGVTWDAPQSLNPGPINQNGSVTTPWYTNAADFTRGIRIVADIGATSGTAVEMARISVVVDFELKS